MPVCRVMCESTSIVDLIFCLFFFSSRRRHTRLQGDWSSDVCSSDLNDEDLRAKALANVEQNGIVFLDEIDKITNRSETIGADVSRQGVQRDLLPLVERSEERRVGKECRSRWSPYH